MDIKRSRLMRTGIGLASLLLVLTLGLVGTYFVALAASGTATDKKATGDAQKTDVQVESKPPTTVLVEPAVFDDIEVPEPLRIFENRPLTRDEIEQLLQENYSSADILAAGELVQRFGSDVRAVLRRRAQGESWETIGADEEQRWQSEVAARRTAAPRVLLGLDGKKTTTPSGLSVAEIEALVGQGHAPDEVMDADALADALEINFWEIIRSTPSGQTWQEAIMAVHNRRTPEEKRAVEQRSVLRAENASKAAGSQRRENGGGKP